VFTVGEQNWNICMHCDEDCVRLYNSVQKNMKAMLFCWVFSRCVDAIYTVKLGMYSFCVYHYRRWTNI